MTKDLKTMNGQELNAIITQSKEDVALYERIKGAAKLLAAAQAELAARAEAAAQKERDFQEAEITRWTIEHVHRSNTNVDALLLAPRVIMAYDKRGGGKQSFSLHVAPRPVVAALARDPKKIPVDILKLGDTPQAALDRWILSMHRGHLAG